MKISKAILVVINVVICLSFGFFVLAFYLAGKPFERGFYCNDQSINKPYKESTIPSTALMIFGFILGIFCFIFANILNFVLLKSSGDSLCLRLKRRKEVIIKNFFVILLIYAYGMGVTTFITDVGKYSIGRLRPHFYNVCKPDWATLNCTDSNGVKNYFIGNKYCTNRDDSKKFKNIRLSFPSGHSSHSAYFATFLILYIDWFIICTNPFAALPKSFVQIALGSGAIYCGFTRVSDYKHHPGDVVAGLSLGFVIAVIIFYGVVVRSCVPLLKLRNIFSSESVESLSGNNQQVMTSIGASNTT